ncbi:SPBc2 prophage-derived protein YotK [Bacillus glycinifermentans]|uniref:Uncharacterized protein n=1 Tax=Bacillus glycinifermentans TaxID=1664069 RepID=A0ABU6H9I0_9BACI|nr:hypothetical protein [Bacillus glycinifermentans]KMM57574.1 SPBc2 prophage-derived protein YotK [Bacillus glycinifermentans]MEC0487285.1 hypothetical protein [Bacillus glycinifermentans]MEC0496598.1 hypothetical protein [Bacillus glycinifermentans]MEC0542394.1 hypothetical protein [Bacillus glycinifermentans]
MEQTNQFESLINKIQRKLDTTKEALNGNDYSRAHRNLINLSNHNEELMYQCRVMMKKG